MPGWLRLRGIGCANYNPATSSVTLNPGPVISNVIPLTHSHPQQWQPQNTRIRREYASAYGLCSCRWLLSRHF